MNPDPMQQDIATFMDEHTLLNVTTETLTCYLLLQHHARTYQRIAEEVKLGVIAVRKIAGTAGTALAHYEIREGGDLWT